MENVHVVVVYDCHDVLQAAATTLTLFLLNILLKIWFFGNWVSSRSKKDLPILVVTLLLYFGLNRITFRWQYFFFFSWLLGLGAW